MDLDHCTFPEKDRKKNKCDGCSKSFEIIATFKIHALTYHKENEKYKCDLCEKRFGRKRSLKYLFLKVRNQTNVIFATNDSNEMPFSNDTF